MQQIVGSKLYYGRAVNITILATLNAIRADQAKATENTRKYSQQLLNYLATHQNATIRYYPSNMILNMHSNAAYLVTPKAQSRAAGHFFLGWLLQNRQPIQLNGAIYTQCKLLKFVTGSAAEAELGDLFHNAQKVKIIRCTSEEIGHLQLPTPRHCDNTTAVGIANNTIKQQRSRAMEMRYFWVADQVENKIINVSQHPGAECLADYPSKAHPSSNHQKVHPFYQHEGTSTRILP